MGKDEFKIIGIKVYTKEGGKKNSILHCLTNFSDYDIEKSERCQGQTVIEEFTNSIDTSFLKIGDIVKFFYTKGFGGKAFLDGISVLESSK